MTGGRPHRSHGAHLIAAVLAVLFVGLRRHERRLVAEVADLLVDSERALRTCAEQRPTPDAASEPLPGLPRTLPFVIVKRTNPRFLGTYGHWWIEVDGLESYGWWADRCPIRVRDLFLGTRGTLNGVGGTCTGGTTTKDPHHGDEADHSFHPTLIVQKTDDEVRQDIRRFAQSFRGRWRYSLVNSRSGCHGFQLELLATVGLLEEAQYLYTRGTGCPFLYPFRSVAWQARQHWDTMPEGRAAARLLVQPGRAAADVVRKGGLCPGMVRHAPAPTRYHPTTSTPR